MTGWIDALVPSLDALGAWSYWIIGAAALLEAFFVTGVVVPGTIIVDAGGALVRLGALDFFDLVWFVAIGAALGGEAGYWTGRRAGARWGANRNGAGAAVLRRTERLFARYGGGALVLGRFLGPVAGMTALAAALAGMSPRRFRLWNWLGAFPYALAHVGLGALAGELVARIGPELTNLAIVLGLLALLFAITWVICVQVRKGVPLLLWGVTLLRAVIAETRMARRVAARRPRLAGFIDRRFDPARIEGLALTALAAVLFTLLGAWAATVIDFLRVPEVAQTDLRLAQLIHTFWTPELLRVFGLVTLLGHWPVVLAVLLTALATLTLGRRWASIVQLLVALGGDLVTVRLLKHAFGRARPELSYYVETSGSFPSGHAALSVAFWGTLMVILWRERVIGPATALFAAALLAASIGISRVYLIEHFLSDVVNGWLIGAFWLVLAFGLAERMRRRAGSGAARRPPAIAAAGMVLAGSAVAIWLVLAANPARTPEAAPVPPAVIDIALAAGRDDLPLDTRTLTGAPVTPVSILVVAPDLGAVLRVWTDAGWTMAQGSAVSALQHLIWSELRGAPNAQTPLLPIFWRGRVQEAGLRSPDGATEMRIWSADARTGPGVPDQAGGAVFALSLAPAIEGGSPWPVGAARRAALALVPGGREVAVAEAVEGRAASGRAWSFDGQVAILSLMP